MFTYANPQIEWHQQRSPIREALKLAVVTPVRQQIERSYFVYRLLVTDISNYYLLKL